MAAASQADCKRKYSWWWDSHISPKNSKWLQENLTDMDSKVKQMIKLIEEDADSFARRAEMYYKKRPELMKLVEEFYRAYRALAERYDHATGVLRQAHRTMAEAFPNQVPFMLADDSPAGSADVEPRTPDMPPICALFDPDELQKDALGISLSHYHAVRRLGAFTEESDSFPGRKGLKQFNDLFGTGEGRERKDISFHYFEEKYHGVQENAQNDIKSQVPSDSDRLGKAEMEIVALRNTLAKLEAEKDAGLHQYQQSLQRLSNLESEVSRAKEDCKGFNERASKAESEVQTLKEALTKHEAEREASLLHYQQCLDKITDLENNISQAQKDAGELKERASEAEIVVQSLKEELTKIEAEKEDILLQYKRSLEKISDLEDKLLHAEEEVRRCYERAHSSEREVETLKEVLAKLTEDKEAAAIQYQKCLDTVSSLEQQLAFAKEEVQRLKSEIDDGFVKLKGAEEKCLLLETSNNTMHSEFQSLAQKMSTQSQELTEKQKELGRLWTCIQEERSRFVEAETAFQTLQKLHSQSQEELRSMASELQNRAWILQDLEACNQSLQNEVEQVKVENKGLNEVNLSSTLTMQNLQEEISNLRQTIGRLESEVELQQDQRNALQQEIYCLKEELNFIDKKNQGILDQVDSVGLSPECLGSSVKSLQDENIKLKEICEKERGQNVSLLEKLEIMEKLTEKNALLENSLSDLNVELNGVRKKIHALEESCQSLLEEKSTLVSEKATLVSQLQIVTDNLETLTEKTNFLENSLFDANAEVEGLRVKSKSLQDLCVLLDNEKSDLVTVKGNLSSQLDITQKRLEDLEKNYTELEEKYSTLEKERESTLHEVEELCVQLNAQQQERASLALLSESQLAGMATQIRLLQEEGQCIKKEHEEELDKAFYAQTEIFILQKCMQDLEEHKLALFLDHQKLREASKLSAKLISQLEHENLEQRVEVKSLHDKIKVLRVGLYRVLKTLEQDSKQGCEDKAEQDQMLLNHALDKLLETQRFLFEMQDENQQWVIENAILVTLLGQLQHEVANLMAAKNSLDPELASRSEQFLLLHGESQKLADVNEELRLTIIEGDHNEETLKVELKTLHGQLLDLQGGCQNLQKEKCKLVDEQSLLMKSISDLGEEKCKLEDENCAFFGETVSLSTICLIFKDIISEKLLEIKVLSENLDKLQNVNNGLDEKVMILEEKLDEKRELHKMVEDLKCKYDEVEKIRADQEMLIIQLYGDLDEQGKEIECIQEENWQMETELGKLNEELLETKIREERLNCELQNGRNEAERWESQAVALFGELQISTVQQALYEGKVHELIELCESLEGTNCLRAREITELSENLDKLHHVNTGLDEKVVTMEGKLSELGVMKDEKRELHKMVEDLKCKYDEVELIRADQEMLIIQLYGDCDSQSKEIEHIREAMRQMETELQKLDGELLETKIREERLNCELQIERNEAERWESQAAALFGEMQISAIQQALYEGKVHELIELCESLEGTNCLRAREITDLSENLDKLHHVNTGLDEKVVIMEGKLSELDVMKDEKRELHKMVEDLKCKNDEVELIRADQEMLIIQLYGDCDSQSKEIEHIREAMRQMETELQKLDGELLETKIREEKLSCELQKGRNEAEWWESQAAALFCKLQISTVQQALYEGKVHELIELCESLEGTNCLRAREIKELNENLDELHHVNNELDEKMMIMEGKLSELGVMQDEKRELHKMLEDLKCKYDEVELMRADQEKLIVQLYGDCDGKSKEIGSICEANRQMETDLGKLNGELLETKIKEEFLRCELQKGRNEAEWWESHAAALFCELQIFVVQQALYEGKVHELIELCESLEGRNSLKAREIKELNENLDKLHGVNNELDEKVVIMEGTLSELGVMKDEKRELHKMLEDLKCKYDEVELIRADQEKLIIQLYGDCEGKSKEIECIWEANRQMETELGKLNGELLETKIKEENFSCELQKGRNEAEWWESQAAELFCKLQITAVQQALYEGKAHELIELCESLEGRNCLKAREIKELSENLDKLHCVNNELDEKVMIMEGKLLELGVMKDEKRELHKMLEDLKCKYDEVELIRADQEKLIIQLYGDCEEKSKEIERIWETNWQMQTELGKLNGELLETKIKEESLSCELQKGRNEAEWWESQAASLFCKLQISVVQQALYEGKVQELIELCESLEGKNCLKAREIKELSENLDKLHCVNNELDEKVMIMEGKLSELGVMQDEKKELDKMLEVLKCKYDEVELIRADQEKLIIQQYGDCEGKSKEIERIWEANRQMETELGKLNGELLETKIKEESLICELQKGRNDADWWESQAATLFRKLQITVVQQALYEGKVHELIELCESLESRNCLKAREIKELSENLDELHRVNSDLDEKVIIMEGKLLELGVMEDEKRELHKTLEDLKCKYDEVELIRADQEKLIIQLYGDCDGKSKEIERILKANRQMETELAKLNGELLEAKIKQENLSCELQNGRIDAKWWESQAAALFCELQIYAVQQALYEGKVHELIESCESLQGRNYLKAREVDQMKERLSTLEQENKELKSQMTSYVPAFNSLADSVAYLENHTLSHATFHDIHKEPKDASFVVHAESRQQICDDQTAMGQGGHLDLQSLQMRIIAIEEAIKERERLVFLENSNANSKLAEAIRQIEELKCRSNLREAVDSSKNRNQNTEEEKQGCAAYNKRRIQKPTHEASEEGNEVMTKDIMLDQISECSSYGISRRETAEGDNQTLEIWETTEQDAGIDLTGGKAKKETAAPSEKKSKKEHSSIESMVDKDVSVDKLEISKRLSGSRQEVNERQLLERLDSDAEKLINLQITLQDLKRKVEITEKKKKGKGIEYDSVKEQLEESEDAITKLFDVNRKLKKSIEDEPLSNDEKSTSASDKSGSGRKRGISEQARRGSEKIGRLQLEVQKLQFLLLKIDDENKSRGKTKIIERKPKVLLRDYLYGGTRKGLKRNKRHFCACVRPPTKGD